MNERLDLTKILKDCPKGTELYSRCIGVVKFESIDDTLKRIIVKNQREIVSYKENGVYYYADEDAEIDLFPSKDQRDWSKWHRPFINGDIVYNKLQDTIGIVMYDKNDFPCKICDVSKKGVLWYNEGSLIAIVERDYRFATEEEKLKLFQIIKDNGYKWNETAKTLEKLIVPKFNVGDSIQSKTNNNDKFTITTIDDNKFYYGRGNGHEFMIPVEKQDNWELTVEPKFKVGNIIQNEDGYKVRIMEVSIKDEFYGYKSLIANGIGVISFNEQENWELVTNKFDITVLKPFDKVLVRYNPDSNWCAAFFSHIDDLKTFCNKFVTTGGTSYQQMIPYNEDTEHLLGTREQAPEFYMC